MSSNPSTDDLAVVSAIAESSDAAEGAHMGGSEQQTGISDDSRPPASQLASDEGRALVTHDHGVSGLQTHSTPPAADSSALAVAESTSGSTSSTSTTITVPAASTKAQQSQPHSTIDSNNSSTKDGHSRLLAADTSPMMKTTLQTGHVDDSVGSLQTPLTGSTPLVGPSSTATTASAIGMDSSSSQPGTTEHTIIRLAQPVPRQSPTAVITSASTNIDSPAAAAGATDVSHPAVSTSHVVDSVVSTTGPKEVGSNVSSVSNTKLEAPPDADTSTAPSTAPAAVGCSSVLPLATSNGNVKHVAEAQAAAAALAAEHTAVAAPAEVPVGMKQRSGPTLPPRPAARQATMVLANGSSGPKPVTPAAAATTLIGASRSSSAPETVTVASTASENASGAGVASASGSKDIASSSHLSSEAATSAIGADSAGSSSGKPFRNTAEPTSTLLEAAAGGERSTKPATNSTASSSGRSRMPALPPRPVTAGATAAAAEEESASVLALRAHIHGIRVALIRTANRLGSDHDSALVMQVLYRLNLAEKIKAPWRRPGKRPDAAIVAAQEAHLLEQSQGPEAPLNLQVTILLVGMSGTGKTQLACSLLGLDTAIDPFEGATQRIEVLRGRVHGVDLVLLDTPGLSAAAGDTAHGLQVLRQIKRCYEQHKPDMVLYVDRLDAPLQRGAELPALRALSTMLGPSFWLNTIVAFTHADAAPPSGKSFDTWAQSRSHWLQEVIRAASFDSRLMNPMAYAECHPNCRRSERGHSLIFNNLSWQPHLFMMLVSAKLLADTEAMLQMQGGPGAAAAPSQAAQHAMMMGLGGPRTMPVPYLMQQMVQQSKPLKFPDHASLMELREAKAQLGHLGDDRLERELSRQIKGRMLQMKQMTKQQEQLAGQYRSASLAGGKITPEPPRLATKTRPSAAPQQTYRYRMPEAKGGWIVRPHLEAHGADNSDGIEGLSIEKVAVARTPGDLLGGYPYHHYLSAQCTKDQAILQARSEATLYHDLPGHTTTSLSLDAQTTSGNMPGVAPDVLAVVRADVRTKHGRKKVDFTAAGRQQAPEPPGGSHKPTLGVMVARLAEEGRLTRGPVVVGARLQDAFKSSIGSHPLEAALVVGHIQPLIEAGANMGACQGANLEISTSLGKPFHAPHAVPLSVGINAVRYRGETVLGVAAHAQARTGARDVVAVRLSAGNKGRAGISLKVKNEEYWWMGAIAMVVPVGALLLQLLGLQ